MKIGYIVSSLAIGLVLGSPVLAETPIDAKAAPAAVPVVRKAVAEPQAPAAVTKEEVPALKARLKEIQELLSILKKEENQLKMTMRDQFVAVEMLTTNLNTTDEEYIALKKDFQATQAKLIDLQMKLRQKLESMPEFKAGSEKLTAVRNKLKEISEKSRALVTERAQVSGKLFQADPTFAGMIKPMERPLAVKPMAATNAVAPAVVPVKK